MKDFSLYEEPTLPDADFPVRVNHEHYQTFGTVIFSHWHEHIELLYFISGRGAVLCNSQPVKVKSGDLVIINSNELHSIECHSDDFAYYCIIITPTLLHSKIPDSCETKYISPITHSLIVFENKINNNPDLLECISCMIEEHERKETGYELLIKSAIYKLLAILLRNYVKSIISPKEYDQFIKNRNRFNEILKYIDDNHMNSITISDLSKLGHISSYHLCHQFKRVTGRTVSEYVNSLRIKKAQSLLYNTDMNITEIAIATGFNDVNYFSRIFRRIARISPSQFRKKQQ